MKPIRTLAARTEFIFHEFAGQIEERNDHLVIRTPSNPTYHWGNLLLYAKAPRRDDFAAWMADQRAAFGPHQKHFVFTGDDNPARHVYESVGFEQVETQFGLSLARPLDLSEPRLTLSRSS